MDTIESNQPVSESWNNRYILDIDMIDTQHMKFFVLFDKLQTLNKNPESYSEISEILNDLEKYTHYHFNTEEALMRKAQSENYEHHVLQHKVFIEKINDFKIAFSYHNSVLLEQMITFLRKWFLMHISEIDKKYVETVKIYLNRKNNND
jgi:hemerythrin